MEKSSNGNDHQPAIVDAEINLCQEPLVEPLIEFQLLQPLSIMLRGGTTFTFPPGVTIYISPADIAYDLGKAFQRVIATTQREEEDRWMRMDQAELKKHRADYIPF